MKTSKLIYSLFITLLGGIIMFSTVDAQPTSLTKEEMEYYTSIWQGERFPDGRPKVPDDIVERMKYVSVTEAWQTLNGLTDQIEQGGVSFGGMRRSTYSNQYSGGDMILMKDDVVICGRASTIHFMPYRPDLNGLIQQKGVEDGRSRGGQYTWGVDQLQDGDCYVANVAEGILDASHVGDNLGTTIWTKTGNGAVIRGTLRDLDGNMGIDPNYNLMVRDFRPQANSSNLVIGVNCPIQIGYVTVMPGDVVLATREGVVFIPPQHAQTVVETSERTRMQDVWAHMGVREGKFTAREADAAFTPEMNEQFTQWLSDHAEDMGQFFEDPNEAPSAEFIRAYVEERRGRSGNRPGGN